MTFRARPIIFSAPMVRAILADEKTQTRRVCSGNWLRCLDPDDEDDRWTATLACPYGWPGDRLWVRETLYTSDGDVFYRADDLAVDCDDQPETDHWKLSGQTIPSIFMPRWASRITLEITDVRVQRLQAISEADAQAEGVTAALFAQLWPSLPLPPAADHAFAHLWDSINAKRGFGWDANPWVWAISFRRVQP